MMARSKPTRSEAPFLMAAIEGQTPVIVFPVDFQNLYSHGMGRAVEIHKASLAATVCLQSCAIDIYRNASCLTPEFAAFLDLAAKSFALCVELHSNWLSLLAPPGMTLIGFGKQAAPTGDELAHHMDIACGHRHTVSDGTVASGSGTRSQPVQRKATSGSQVA
jgi:hypothetical protein